MVLLERSWTQRTTTVGAHLSETPEAARATFRAGNGGSGDLREGETRDLEGVWKCAVS